MLVAHKLKFIKQINKKKRSYFKFYFFIKIKKYVIKS